MATLSLRSTMVPAHEECPRLGGVDPAIRPDPLCGRQVVAQAQRSDPPTWTSWREVPGVVLYRPHLRRTATVALVVGTILFAINQLDVVMRGDATTVVWIKSAVTFVVPFCVANAGVLVGTRTGQRGR